MDKKIPRKSESHCLTLRQFLIFSFTGCYFFSISECGTTVLKDSSVQTFIMNGRPAGIEEWPWQGRLILDDMVRYCGVSLIHTKWALTAAHCLV